MARLGDFYLYEATLKLCAVIHSPVLSLCKVQTPAIGWPTPERCTVLRQQGSLKF